MSNNKEIDFLKALFLAYRNLKDRSSYVKVSIEDEERLSPSIIDFASLVNLYAYDFERRDSILQAVACVRAAVAECVAATKKPVQWLPWWIPALSFDSEYRMFCEFTVSKYISLSDDSGYDRFFFVLSREEPGEDNRSRIEAIIKRFETDRDPKSAAKATSKLIGEHRFTEDETFASIISGYMYRELTAREAEFVHHISPYLKVTIIGWS